MNANRSMILVNWAHQHEPPDAVARRQFWAEMSFLRVQLAELLAGARNILAEESMMVVAAFLTGSNGNQILMPIVRIETPEAFFFLGSDFRGWRVSVRSLRGEVCVDFGNLFDPRKQILNFDGCSMQWICSPYSINKQDFSSRLRDRYSLFTFFWLLTRALKEKGGK